MNTCLLLHAAQILKKVKAPGWGPEWAAEHLREIVCSIAIQFTVSVSSWMLQAVRVDTVNWHPQNSYPCSSPADTHFLPGWQGRMAKLATMADPHGQQVLYELVHRLSEEHEAAWIDSIVQELVGAGGGRHQHQSRLHHHSAHHASN
jgi:hypothetical protein